MSSLKTLICWASIQTNLFMWNTELAAEAQRSRRMAKRTLERSQTRAGNPPGRMPSLYGGH